MSFSFGLPDPNPGPIIRGTDPDPASAPESFYLQPKIVRKTLIPTVLNDFFMTFYLRKIM